MKEKIQKVLVFDRKEVFLMLLFMVLASITSFSVGVKVGRGLAFHEAGITHQDRETVELKSKQEREVQEITAKEPYHPEPKDKLIDETYQKLQEEFHKMQQPGVASKENASASHTTIITTATPHTAEALKSHEGSGEESAVESVAESATESSEESPKGSLHEASSPSPSASTGEVTHEPANPSEGGVGGKYTIQLGSFPQNQKVEAERFADGLRVRGYDPIISEVRIETKGIWFRVSLGMFESMGSAKDYIQSEEALFQGQDYVITEIR